MLYLQQIVVSFLSRTSKSGAKKVLGFLAKKHEIQDKDTKNLMDKKKTNTILKGILIPFLLIFLTLFLTHMGMQTKLVDQEFDKSINKDMITHLQFLKDDFLGDEVQHLAQILSHTSDFAFRDIWPDGKEEHHRIFSTHLRRWQNDLDLDQVAILDEKGKLVAKESLSSNHKVEEISEFQDLVEQGRVSHEIYGFDQTTQGLVLKMIIPIRHPREIIVGYILAIRPLRDNFFKKIYRLTGLDVLIFKDERAIFSTIPTKTDESLSIPPEIQQKILQSNTKAPQAFEQIYIYDIQYHALSFSFQNFQGQTVGTLMLVSSLQDKKESLKKIILKLLWASLIGGTLLLFFGFLISKGITSPIEQLIKATHRVSSGDFTTRADIDSHQELITLSKAFNNMTENLQRTLISKNYFHAIINTINDLLIIISPEHRITFVNQATLKVLGYERDELIGRTFDFVFQKDCPLKELDFDTIAQRGVIDGHSCTMLTQTGETIPVSFLGWPMLDENQNLIEIVGVARDIREKAEAEREVKEERDKLNTLINTTNDLIFIRNYQGDITFVSHAVQRILGYTPEEFKNLPDEKMLSSNPINQSFMESPARLGRRGEVVEPYWTEFLTQDGKPIFLEINEAPLLGKKGEITQIMGIGRDISERKRLEEQLRDWQENRSPTRQRTYQFGNIIGNSPKMLEIYDLINTVSQNNSTVLLKGESGTGKELIAQAIHGHSSRHDYPLIEVTCSVLSEHLLESELFGHVKGAFTGAINDKPGRFEQANGGTIFLDEIGDISLNEQIKLLRVVQEREIVRVGGRERIKIDVRIIAATNKDLMDAVTKGTFREDLYYRLNVVPITVPTLRERKEDIPLLVDHFIKKMNLKIGKQVKGISQKALNILWEYNWPGNIRQLENTVEYAVIRCRDLEIKVRDLPQEVFNLNLDYKMEKASSMQELLEHTEKSSLLDILENHQWNITKTAKKLNISRTTLWRKMRKHEISKPDDLETLAG